jgi:hypothetical protein
MRFDNKLYIVKFIASILIASGIVVGLQAQSVGPATSATAESLRNSISRLDSVIPLIKKKEARIDSLELLIAYQDSLVKVLDGQIAGLQQTIASTPDPYTMWPMSLMAQDESVFKIENVGELTDALKKRCVPIGIAGEIDALITETDTIITRLKSTFPDNNSVNINSVIRPGIDNNVMRLSSLFKLMDEVDISPLSKEQQQYLDALKERYKEYRQYYQ